MSQLARRLSISIRVTTQVWLLQGASDRGKPTGGGGSWKRSLTVKRVREVRVEDVGHTGIGRAVRNTWHCVTDVKSLPAARRIASYLAVGPSIPSLQAPVPTGRILYPPNSPKRHYTLHSPGRASFSRGSTCLENENTPLWLTMVAKDCRVSPWAVGEGEMFFEGALASTATVYHIACPGFAEVSGMFAFRQIGGRRSRSDEGKVGGRRARG